MTRLVRRTVDAAPANSRSRATGKRFEIEFIQKLTIRDGRIVRWKSSTDPSPILAALSAN